MSADLATTLVGIHNEREFYSDHYLAEILSIDLARIMSGCRQPRGHQAQNEPSPDARLRALAVEYQKFRSAFERETVVGERLKCQRMWLRQLLGSLDHGWAPRTARLEDESEIPVLDEREGAGGVRLVVLEAYHSSDEECDPLEIKLDSAQFLGEAPPHGGAVGQPWGDIITDRLFSQDRPPRWVLLLSAGQTLLVERGKWTHGRLLRFDWNEIFGLRDAETLRVASALLHRESLVPGSGSSLLDSLDEKSHRHAFGVSKDLKYALREAIELLGNEAVRSLKEDLGESPGDSAEFAEQLGLECLRYMYRLLFLFYIEARPELGYAPVEAEAYRKGYSLERLRDMELANLAAGADADACHVQKSLSALFGLVRNGFRPRSHADRRLGYGQGGLYNTFEMSALDSALFDDRRTPLLARTRLRDTVMQRVVESLSLTGKAKGRRRRGRVSYGQLGINQLGEVYESLMSFRGFFAKEDLYEVTKAGVRPDKLSEGWFVPARRA